MTTVTVLRLIGRMAIVDSGRGKTYPVGPGFTIRPDAEHLKHRETYTFVQAQEVADWVNGVDRSLNIVARSVDMFDPVQRQSMRAGDYRCDTKGTPRKGLTPLPDKE